MPSVIRALYIERVEKTPLLCKFQMKASLLLVSLIVKTLPTSSYQVSRLCPMRALRKDTFSGEVGKRHVEISISQSLSFSKKEKCKFLGYAQ
jgi:hypothetical protein